MVSSRDTNEFNQLLDIIESARPEDYTRLNQTKAAQLQHLFKLDPDLLPRQKKRKRRPLTINGKPSSIYCKLTTGPDGQEIFVKIKTDQKATHKTEKFVAPVRPEYLRKLLNGYNKQIQQ
jgi:hypothetical protein